ncbi:MAG: prephenate dehydratase [Candidatus Izemoplasmatales bacterium]
MKVLKIAVLGEEKSYSHIAAIQWANSRGIDVECMFVSEIADVFEEVVQGVDIGVVPIENSVDGYIQYHMDLLRQHELQIFQELAVPISFDYVSQTKSPQEIIMQYAVKGQCRQFLRMNPIPVTLVRSNTEAANFYGQRQNVAAIVPKHLVENLTKQVHISNIADQETNSTRFVLIAKEELVKPKSCKDIKAMFVLTPKEDYPGLLYGLLETFAKEKMNLISIMSRPIGTGIGRFRFFFELVAPAMRQTELQAVLTKLQPSFQIDILGVYPFESQ